MIKNCISFAWFILVLWILNFNTKQVKLRRPKALNIQKDAFNITKAKKILFYTKYFDIADFEFGFGNEPFHRHAKKPTAGQPTITTLLTLVTLTPSYSTWLTSNQTKSPIRKGGGRINATSCSWWKVPTEITFHMVTLKASLTGQWPIDWTATCRVLMVMWNHFRLHLITNQKCH